MSCGFGHNYFNCCSGGFWLCLKAAGCPCFVLGESVHRMENGGDMSGYNCCCNLDCAVLCLLGGHGMGWVWNAYRRYQIREKYSIGKQSFCGAICDICASGCLTCALVQQEKETRDRNPEPHVDQYQANGRMQVHN